MRSVICFILFTLSFCLTAQESDLKIRFNPSFNNETIILNKPYLFNNDSISFEILKFYISNIQLFQNEQLVYTEIKKHHLIDLENPKSLEIIISKAPSTPFNSIVFKLGIDSITNVSGAFGEDLDPTNGMYWTWQSGYINFKLEGITALCPTRNNFFQFHIGGYQYPFNTIQSIKIETNNATEITIDILVDKLLSKIDLRETFEIMSPNKKAVELACLISSVFKLSE